MKEIKPARSLTAARRLSKQASDLFSAASTLKLLDVDRHTVALVEDTANKLADAAREFYVRGK